MAGGLVFMFHVFCLDGTGSKLKFDILVNCTIYIHIYMKS